MSCTPLCPVLTALPAHTIVVKNLQNEVTKRITPPDASADAIFPATTGCVILRSEDRVSLFDLQRKAVVGELNVVGVKRVVWSQGDKEAMVALVGRDSTCKAAGFYSSSCYVWHLSFILSRPTVCGRTALSRGQCLTALQ